MKKTVSLILILLVLVSCLAVEASAKIKEKNAVGSIVYVKYSETAPDMSESKVGEGWGDAIHLDSQTNNCGIFAQPIHNTGMKRQFDDQEVDVYFTFTDECLYWCITSPDQSSLGGIEGGDAYCFFFEFDNPKLIFDEETYGSQTYRTFGSYLEFDDVTVFTPKPYCKECTWYYDGTKYIWKMSITWKELDATQKDLDEGIIMNFCFTRGDADETEVYDSYGGWFYWGKWYNYQYNDSLTQPLTYRDAEGPNSWVISKENKRTVMTYTYEEPSKIAGDVGETVKEEPKQETPSTTDKPSSWAAEEVNAAISLGLVPTELQKSYTTGITRGQLALMLSSLLTKAGVTLPTSGNATFTDTTDANVLAAANLGIINGYKQADGTYMFKPNNTLKRSEMSAIINRVAKLCGKTTTGFEKEVTFTDTASHWCNSELGYPVHMGIVKGTSATTFSPENTLTIEQTVMMVYRTLSALAK